MSIMNIKTAFLSAVTTLTTTQAFAHAGHHHDIALSQMVSHLLLSPFHMGAIGISLIALVVGVAWFGKRKKQRQ